uniref:Uncharacterized protein n=1 Tax=Plectus sambesii TaxID=2011161 RepID=A0A914WHM0_9BILA
MPRYLTSIVIEASLSEQNASMIANVMGAKRTTINSIISKFPKEGHIEAKQRGGVEAYKHTADQKNFVCHGLVVTGVVERVASGEVEVAAAGFANFRQIDDVEVDTLSFRFEHGGSKINPQSLIKVAGKDHLASDFKKIAIEQIVLLANGTLQLFRI